MATAWMYHDGTRKACAARRGNLLTAQEFTVANPDGNKTISAEEWFDLVRRRFYAANPDNDGSISVDELRTPQGQALLTLVQ